MDKHGDADSRIAEEAAGWLLRLEEERSAECIREFVAWMRCPRHIEAFLMITAIHEELGGIDPQRRIDVAELLARMPRRVALIDAQVTSANDRNERNVWVHDAAGELPAADERKHTRLMSLAAALGVLAIGLQVAQHQPGAPTAPFYETEIGENRAITLEDGSTIHLNTNSRVAVQFTRQARDVDLLAGEAIFHVKRDTSRPFRVRAHNLTVQALGTVFDVRRHPNHVRVTVLSGVVEVSAAQGSLPPIRLVAGQEMSVPLNVQPKASQVVKLALSRLAARQSWTRGFLQFDQHTLAEAVGEFNRYNHRQIRILDPEIGTIRISGTYRSTDPRGFVLQVEQMIEELDVVDETTAPAHDIELRRRKVEPARTDDREPALIGD